MSDQQVAPGWYPDPTRRFEHRYWDGGRWTEYVLVAGSQQVDRFWDGPSAEENLTPRRGAVGRADARFVPPSTEDALRPTLADRLRGPRPAPSVQGAVAAVAGISLVFGIMFAAGDSLHRMEVALLGVLITAIAYGIALVGPPGSRSAGLAGAIVGPAMIVLAGATDVFDGRAEVAVPALVLSVVWIAMFLGQGFTGAPVLLVAGLVSVWTAFVVAAFGGGGGTWYGSGVAWDSADTGAFRVDGWNDLSAAGLLTTLAAIGCVVTAGRVDRRGWQVLGTPLIATGVLLAFSGLFASSAGSNGDPTVPAVLTLAFGVTLLVVGAQSERRGSVWIGAAAGASGVLGLVGQAAESARAIGMVYVVVAALLFMLAPWLGRTIVPSNEATDHARDGAPLG